MHRVLLGLLFCVMHSCFFFSSFTSYILFEYCVNTIVYRYLCYADGYDSIVILAGDTRPVEVICHLPVICEENGLPYCFVPSKEVSCIYHGIWVFYSLFTIVNCYVVWKWASLNPPELTTILIKDLKKNGKKYVIVSQVQLAIIKQLITTCRFQFFF